MSIRRRNWKQRNGRDALAKEVPEQGAQGPLLRRTKLPGAAVSLAIRHHECDSL